MKKLVLAVVVACAAGVLLAKDIPTGRASVKDWALKRVSTPAAAPTVTSPQGGWSGTNLGSLYSSDPSSAYSTASSTACDVTTLFSSAQVANTIQLFAPKDSPNQMASAFTVSASNDGSNWTELLSVSGETGWFAAECRYYMFPNTTAYTHYKLSVTATCNNGNARLGVFNYFKAVEPDPMTPWTYNSSVRTLTRGDQTIYNVDANSSQVQPYGANDKNVDLYDLDFSAGVLVNGQIVKKVVIIAAFKANVYVTRIVAPDSGSNIDGWGLENCWFLNQVVFGETTTGIGKQAFNKCYSLEHVDISRAKVGTLENVFSGCVNISGDLVIPGTTVSSTFKKKVTSLSLPDAKSVGSATQYFEMFGENASLTNVVLGANLQQIVGGRVLGKLPVGTHVDIWWQSAPPEFTYTGPDLFGEIKGTVTNYLPKSKKAAWVNFATAHALTGFTLTLPTGDDDVGSWTSGSTTAVKWWTDPEAGHVVLPSIGSVLSSAEGATANISLSGIVIGTDAEGEPAVSYDIYLDYVEAGGPLPESGVPVKTEQTSLENLLTIPGLTVGKSYDFRVYIVNSANVKSEAKTGSFEVEGPADDIPGEGVSMFGWAMKRVSSPAKNPSITAAPEGDWTASAATLYSSDPSSAFVSVPFKTCEITMGFDDALVADTIQLFAPSASMDQMVGAFKVYGSSDGTSWKRLVFVENIPAWLTRECRYYRFANETPYRFYKLAVMGSVGGGTVRLGAFNYFRASPADPTTPWTYDAGAKTLSRGDQTIYNVAWNNDDTGVVISSDNRNNTPDLYDLDFSAGVVKNGGEPSFVKVNIGSAFNEYKNITRLVGQKNVTWPPKWGMQRCWYLNQLALGGGVSNPADDALRYSYSLQFLDLTGLQTLPSGSFDECWNLRGDLVVPSETVKCGFGGTKITSVSYPNVTMFGNGGPYMGPFGSLENVTVVLGANLQTVNCGQFLGKVKNAKAPLEVRWCSAPPTFMASPNLYGESTANAVINYLPWSQKDAWIAFAKDNPYGFTFTLPNSPKDTTDGSWNNQIVRWWKDPGCSKGMLLIIK